MRREECDLKLVSFLEFLPGTMDAVTGIVKFRDTCCNPHEFVELEKMEMVTFTDMMSPSVGYKGGG